MISPWTLWLRIIDYHDSVYLGMDMDFYKNLVQEESERHDSYMSLKYKYIKSLLSDFNIRIINNGLTDEPIIRVWKSAKIEPNTRFFYMNQLGTLGAYSYTHTPPFNGFSAGRYCSIASNVRLFGAAHYPDWVSSSSIFYDSFITSDRPLTFSERMRNRTKIGHDVWIGSDVAIARNVSIGNGAIIATGSIVTKDVPAYAVVGGVAAKILKYRFEKSIIDELESIQWWDYSMHDLKGLNFTAPRSFIDEFRNRVERGEIEKYSPKYIDLSEFLDEH